MHGRQEQCHEEEESPEQAASEQPAAASVQSIAIVAQQLLASAAATCGLDLGSLSQFAFMAASQPSSQPSSQVPQTPEQLMAAALAAATFLSQANQANQLAGSAAASQLGGSAASLNPLLSAAASNSSLSLGANLNQAILPEDLTTPLADSVQRQQEQQQAALKLEQHLSNHHQSHQLNGSSQGHLNLSGHTHTHHSQSLAGRRDNHSAALNGMVSSLGPVRDTHSNHHRSHPYQRHSDSSGASSANSDSHHQHHAGHPQHHHQTRHLLGHHHHSSIQTQQQLLATRGYNPLAVVVGSGQQTEILTPTHLKKAKLMFYYVRYPNSSTLKECFRDVRFNKNNTAQLVKWFSNFREFYYIQMEKFARDAVNDERIRCKEDIVVTYDHELINVLNNHYNKNRHIELPEVFRQVVEETLRHFFEAIHTKRDQEQSWKKAIYKVIARLDQEVPEVFKTEAFNEHLE